MAPGDGHPAARRPQDRWIQAKLPGRHTCGRDAGHSRLAQCRRRRQGTPRSQARRLHMRRSMSHRTWVLSIGTSVAALLAVPAGASAVTATFNQPCYTHIPTQGSQPIVVSLTGGTPGANFLVSATVPGKGTGSAGSANGTFDAAGNGTAAITDVSPPSGTIDATRGQRINLSVADSGAGGTDVPVGSTLVTNLSMTV